MLAHALRHHVPTLVHHSLGDAIREDAQDRSRRFLKVDGIFLVPQGALQRLLDPAQEALTGTVGLWCLRGIPPFEVETPYQHGELGRELGRFLDRKKIAHSMQRPAQRQVRDVAAIVSDLSSDIAQPFIRLLQRVVEDIEALLGQGAVSGHVAGTFENSGLDVRDCSRVTNSVSSRDRGINAATIEDQPAAMTGLVSSRLAVPLVSQEADHGGERDAIVQTLHECHPHRLLLSHR